MAIHALMLFGDKDWQAWLEQHLGAQSRVLLSDADDLVGSMDAINSNERIDLLFVRLVDDAAISPALIVEALVDAYPGVPCIGVSDADNAELVLGAMRAGAVDVFVRGRDEDRIGSLSARALKRSASSAVVPSPQHQRAKRGQVVSLVSAAQSSLLAYSLVHLGVAIKDNPGTRDKRVLLIDFSLPGGDSSIIFESSADFGVLDVLRDMERCDDTLIASAFPTIESGCYLLALPEHLNSDLNLAGELVDLPRLLEICRSYFDYTVICGDAGMGLSALSALVQGSDHASLMSDQSVLCSRQSKALTAALRGMDSAASNLHLIIANYRPQGGIEPERLAALLDLPLEATLSGKVAARVEAMNLGQSMFEHAPSDGFAVDIRSLAARLFGFERAQVSSAGVVGRLQKLWRR